MTDSVGKNYVGSSVVSKLFSMSERRVQQLTQEGIISAHKVNGDYRYDLPQVTRQYIKHLSDKIAGREKNSTIAELELQKSEVEVRLKNIKADMLELQHKELIGKMIRSEDVEAVMTDHVFELRGMLIALPGRLAVDVSGADTAVEASNIIRAEVYHILSALANYKFDSDVYTAMVREREGWGNVIVDDSVNSVE